jgi:hypothetical protein
MKDPAEEYMDQTAVFFVPIKGIVAGEAGF